MSDVQKDAEAISRLIKERITPLPQFILKPLQEDGKNLLALEVSPGRSTPYYYKADGVMEAYIRVGNESVIAPDYIVNELILKGSNQSFNTLTTDAVKKDYSFTLLEATYLERTGLRFEPSDYVSFGLTDITHHTCSDITAMSICTFVCKVRVCEKRTKAVLPASTLRLSIRH